LTVNVQYESHTLPLSPEVIGNVVLPLFVPELIKGYVLAFGQALHRLAKLLGNLPEHDR
jgi:ABC-type sulfate transport system permease component